MSVSDDRKGYRSAAVVFVIAERFPAIAASAGWGMFVHVADEAAV
jgi:hypothetical protein